MTALLVAAAAACALLAVRAQRLLQSALYLAGLSMLTAVILYRLGAPEAAVVELSVGAGLVTVLFVFAIAITGEEAIEAAPLIPAPLAWLLVILAVVGVGAPVLPLPAGANAAGAASVGVERAFREYFWEARGLDALVQAGLIFAGVMGILGLLAERGRRAL